MRRIATLFALLVAALAGGCDSFSENVACPAVVWPAIAVEVRDAGTGAYVAGSASGYIRDGEFVDELVPYVFTGTGVVRSLQAGLGRPGTYDVFLEAPGYAPFEARDVLVGTDICGVVTTNINAELHRP
jgi:hypothetical protein